MVELFLNFILKRRLYWDDFKLIESSCVVLVIIEKKLDSSGN